MFSVHEDFAVRENGFATQAMQLPSPTEGFLFTSAFKTEADYYITRASLAFLDLDGQCSIFAADDLTPISKPMQAYPTGTPACTNAKGAMSISHCSRTFTTARGTFYEKPEGILLENFRFCDFKSAHCSSRLPLG